LKLENVINQSSIIKMDVYPKRLVMFTIDNNCMFCEQPKGPSFVTYVYIKDNMGFISCNLCKEKMAEATKTWRETLAYGKVRYLKDSFIKIKRSSGEIEDGWKLGSPCVIFNEKSQTEVIQCIEHNRDLQRWCKVDDIIEFNPPLVNDDEYVYKNLCLICGVDMGDDNPRQLCGKTQCNNED
jgi:hypothetical protein